MDGIQQYVFLQRRHPPMKARTAGVKKLRNYHLEMSKIRDVSLTI
jgi:hypothetical protein